MTDEEEADGLLANSSNMNTSNNVKADEISRDMKKTRQNSPSHTDSTDEPTPKGTWSQNFKFPTNT